MKSTAFEIHIPTKCTVSESNFRPHEKGDWCLSCRKTVVDFTDMSDAEIIRYFQDKPMDAQLCGTWRKDQLNKSFQPAPVSQPASGWWPVLLGSFLSVLSVGKMSAQATDPMTWKPVPTETNSFQETSPEIAEVKPAQGKVVAEKKDVKTSGFRKITIRLKVKYGTKTLRSDFLEGMCKETSETFIVDHHGVGTLTVPDSTEEYTLTILVKPRGYHGYQAQTITVVPDKKNYKVKSDISFRRRLQMISGRYRVRRKVERISIWRRIQLFLNLVPPRYGR